MQAILLIPENGSQFHLGERSLDDTSDILHADTLFSALANVYEMALSGASTIIRLMKTGKLCFSSGLYAVQYKNQSVFFIPKPPVDYSGTKELKTLKRVKYISVGVWKMFLESLDTSSCVSMLDLMALPSIGGEFVYSENELPGILNRLDQKVFRNVRTSPKVKVHTTDREDCLYHETTVQFNAIELDQESMNGAYYFFLQHDLTAVEFTEFMAAVRIMADEGVGGQRTSGHGQFASVQVVEIELPPCSAPSLYLGLSLISPENDSEFHHGLRDYELIVRGGGSLGKTGIAEEHRRQARFVCEGALLRQQMSGRFIDISPEQDGTILRNGFNFSLPIGTPI